MRYLTTMALACLIAIPGFSVAGEDEAVKRLTESVLQECNGDETCLANASREFEAMSERLARSIEFTEGVLEEARSAPSKPAVRKRQKLPELQSGSDIYREIIGTDPY